MLATRWPYPVSLNRRLGQEEIVLHAGGGDEEEEEIDEAPGHHQQQAEQHEDREPSVSLTCWYATN